jgi:hypothetical protein
MSPLIGEDHHRNDDASCQAKSERDSPSHTWLQLVGGGENTCAVLWVNIVGSIAQRTTCPSQTTVRALHKCCAGSRGESRWSSNQSLPRIRSPLRSCLPPRPSWIANPQLTQHRVSDNVGGAKQFLSTLLHALEEERRFALGENCHSNQRLARNPLRSGTRSDPCISSISNCDHDYYFELLVLEERDAQSIARCSTAHHRDVRVVPRANRTCSTADSHIPGASSSTDEPPACGPLLPWQFFVLAASSGGNTCCATRVRCAPSPAPLPPIESATSNSLAW